MRTITRIAATLTAILLVGLVAAPATAGSPHFIKSAFVVTVDGATLTVSGKEAGLGDETQVAIRVTATAACLNPGENFPRAGNKSTFAAAGVFPVQNGKADFSLTLTATFQPRCAPPMTVVWGGVVTVTDVEHNVTATLRL